MAIVIGRDEQPMFHDFLGINQGDDPRKQELEPSSINGLRKNLAPMEEGEGETSTKTLSVHSGGFDLSAALDPASYAKASGVLCADMNTIYSSEAADRMHVKKRSSFINEAMLQEHMNKDETGGFCNTKVLRFDPNDFPPYKHSDAGQDNFQSRVVSLSQDARIMQPPALKQDYMLPMKQRQDGCGQIFTNGQLRLAQAEKISASSLQRENMMLSLGPADEGSRTGLRGSSLTSIFNSDLNNPSVRVSAGLSQTFDWSKQTSSANARTESNYLSLNEDSHSRGPLTIFYRGQAHVFDDVPVTKAESILSLAGSSGRSWSTSYLTQKIPSTKVSVGEGPPPISEIEKEKAPLKGVVNGMPGLAPNSDMSKVLIPASAQPGLKEHCKRFSHISQSSIGSAQANNKDTSISYTKRSESRDGSVILSSDCVDGTGSEVSKTAYMLMRS